MALKDKSCAHKLAFREIIFLFILMPVWLHHSVCLILMAWPLRYEKNNFPFFQNTNVKKKKKKEGRGGQARNGGSNKSHQWILLNKSCHKIKSHRVLKLQFYLIYKQENSQEGAQRRGSIVRCSERVLFFFSFPHQERWLIIVFLQLV